MRCPHELTVGVRPGRAACDRRRSPAFIAEVEKTANELVRAAAAFSLGGTGYQGEGPKGAFAHVSGGFFNYVVVLRHERLYIMQVTYL